MSLPLRRAVFGAMAWIAVVGLAGCQPQIASDDPDDYAVIIELNNAIAAKRPDLLDRAKQRIAERRRLGKFSERAESALGAIIAKAEAGQWETALSDLFAFQKAQR